MPSAAAVASSSKEALQSPVSQIAHRLEIQQPRADLGDLRLVGVWACTNQVLRIFRWITGGDARVIAETDVGFYQPFS